MSNRPVRTVHYRNRRPSPYVAGCWGVATMDREEEWWFWSKAAAIKFLVSRSVVGRIVTRRIRAGLYEVRGKLDGHTYYIATADALRQEGWDDAIAASTYVGDRQMTRAIRCTCSPEVRARAPGIHSSHCPRIGSNGKDA